MNAIVGRWRRVALLVVLSLPLLLLGSHPAGGPVRAQVADPCTVLPANPVACENSLPGNPASEWDITGAGSGTIQGFATEISVNRGETVRFKINTDATAYRLEIYRLGYYGGLGARRQAVILPSASLPQAQPACAVDGATGLVDCGVWAESASWAVPANAVSGIYVAKLVRTDALAGSSHVVFVVRDDTGQSDVLFQTADTTWQAYNRYGGNSLYFGSPAGRAYKVSYNRPFTTREYAPEDWVFNAEYPMVRWLEANGYNVSYTTGVDTDRRGPELLEHKVFLSVGHDEYWSGQQRANVEAARDEGVHLAFFSGNEIFWKTRWEPSIDGSSTPYRTLVSYKDTHANAKIDPLPGVWTGTWRDTRFSPPNDGGRPENALTGQLFVVNAGTSAIEVPAAEGKYRFWRNTSIASLASGTVATLAAGTLGYEWDEAPIVNAPPGLIRLSRTTRSGIDKLQDFGNTYGTGTATHSLTLYRAASGALVFGAGTVQWPWGLDAFHDRTASVPDVRMQQATLNLLADMGVQPSTIRPGLVAATASADLVRPSSTITAPANNAVIAPNAAVTISGTAADVGGVVAGVEVSVDNGTTWRAATGTTAWTFAWTAPASGTVVIQSRAIDDSGNVQSPGATVTVTTGVAPPPTPPAGTVAAFGFGEGSGTTTADGSGRNNNGTLSNATWTAAGKNGSAVSFNGTSSWITVPDASSLDLTTGMTIEAWVRPTSISGWRTVLLKERGTNQLAYGLYASDGSRPAVYINLGGGDVDVTGTSSLPVNTWSHLAATYDGSTLRLFVNGVQVGTRAASGPMLVSSNPLRLGGNAVWGEYFAGQLDDVRVYARALSAAEIVTDMNTPASPPDAVPPAVTEVTPAAASINVFPETKVTARFNEDMAPASLTAASFQLRDGANALVPAGVSYDAGTRTATLTPSAPLGFGGVYVATLGGATDLAGNAMAAPTTWSFTVAPRGMFCPCSIWLPSDAPAVLEVGDASSVEVGVKFRTDRPGFITGIRFYKGPGNTGTHVGNLWSATGTLLASALFTSETASGWQQATFSPAVAVAADTTYVASYFAPNGRYSFSAAALASGVSASPLHAVASSESPNGVFRYSALSGFPTDSFNAGNYWVDVVFADTVVLDTTPPTASGFVPAAGATGVSTSASIKATFSEGMDQATVTSASFELRRGTTLVPSTVTYDPVTHTATLEPAAALASGTVYTATLRGGATDPRVKDAAGNALAANAVWSFTTAAAAPAPPDSGPGGPILVIASAGNPFGRYYGEILQNEGLNLFRVTDISRVTAATLASYDVVILGEMTLTPAQVTMLTTWVTNGGNLIAMRPDRQLAGLLGLTDANGTLANRYLAIAPSGPGAGLVTESIQFHGTADLYTATSATPIATLYSNATTATANPAVTLRSVGAAGGQAAAFTYDLARSVVYTRQGNPAWAGTERDGTAPIRSNDMFFGGAETDWVDLNKVAIPQADEQQRLLANLILQMNQDRKPLPKAWYLPRGLKAAVVMTGDDHGIGGTVGRFDIHKAESPAGCSVNDWECVRATSYIYTSTPMTPQQVAAYTAEGFEVAVHITTQCGNYTQASLMGTFATQLGEFQTRYGGPAPVTNRTHCIAFSDWASQPIVSAAHGIRMDTNYYYWPGPWVADRPGFMTGSGMPMRFANTDGTIIDVYQAATQLTDESNQTYPSTINRLLDNALGAEGYYGVFTTNMHTDAAPHAASSAIVASARARNVPVVSARQMLTWLDGRNGTTFTPVVWTNGVLTFTVAPGAGANGLQVLLPAQAVQGPITSLTRNGAPVAFTLQTIKGMEYAVFAAAAGSYTAAYVQAPETTITSAPPASTTSTSATFGFSSPSSGVTFQCSLDGAAYGACVSPVAYNGLSVGTHTFSVRAVSGGMADPTPAAHAWTVALAPADTTITSSPAASTTSTSASFSFVSVPAGATFECSLDGAAFAACASPAAYTNLALGSHTFAVRAVNAAGPDATPATFGWAITLPLPDTTITSSPAAVTASTSATFAFTATPAGATFECSLDTASFTACASPQAYTALSAGAHTFRVRAVNAAGTDASPAAFSWTIGSAPSGLVLALGFEEGTGSSTADSSGFGNNGTLSNATWSASGRYGSALSFNGSNAWVTVADAASLDLTTGMTLEAWVRPATNAGWRSVLLKESASGLAYSIYGSDGARPSAYIRVGTDRNTDGTAALPLNTWTHVAATYDGTTLRFYVNGVQVSSAAVSGAMTVSTLPLRIGGNAPWGEYFSGLIDEVRIYNRTLTAAEIQSDMNTAVRP